MEPHALEEMLHEEHGVIDQSEVNDAIDRGTHFWDSQQGSLTVFENGVAPGERRVGAAIDVDRKVVSTVFRDVRDDDQLGSVIWTEGEAQYPRYIKLPPKE
jgi:hypothetical protein